jgi:hypothetical protein
VTATAPSEDAAGVRGKEADGDDNGDGDRLARLQAIILMMAARTQRREGGTGACG